MGRTTIPNFQFVKKNQKKIALTMKIKSTNLPFGLNTNGTITKHLQFMRTKAMYMVGVHQYPTALYYMGLLQNVNYFHSNQTSG